MESQYRELRSFASSRGKAYGRQTEVFTYEKVELQANSYVERMQNLVSTTLKESVKDALADPEVVQSFKSATQPMVEESMSNFLDGFGQHTKKFKDDLVQGLSDGVSNATSELKSFLKTLKLLKISFQTLILEVIVLLLLYKML